VEEERDFKAKCAWHNLPGVFCRAGFAGQDLPDGDQQILLFVSFPQCHLKIVRLFCLSSHEHARCNVICNDTTMCLRTRLGIVRTLVIKNVLSPKLDATKTIASRRFVSTLLLHCGSC
jgi:hypothetical protein